MRHGMTRATHLRAIVMCDTVMSAEKKRENVTCEDVLFTNVLASTASERSEKTKSESQEVPLSSWNDNQEQGDL